jgi:flavin-binding protein dodecin
MARSVLAVARSRARRPNRIQHTEITRQPVRCGPIFQAPPTESGHVCRKITEIQSSSTTSFEDAINAGIARADKTLRNLTGAWIKSQKVVIEKGKITEYRVLMKVSFILQDK